MNFLLTADVLLAVFVLIVHVIWDADPAILAPLSFRGKVWLQVFAMCSMFQVTATVLLILIWR